jgi:predicted nucleic acid-binding protein
MSLRIAVSDAGPIHYLIWIGHGEVFPKLFERVLIPSQVQRELRHPKAPASVREFIENAPKWIDVVDGVDELKLPNLHSGEAAALSLAVRRKAEILIDDHAGRNAARSLGMQPIGTLAIMERASEKGFLEIGLAIEKLRNTNFYFDPGLMEDILRRSRKPGL